MKLELTSCSTFCFIWLWMMPVVAHAQEQTSTTAQQYNFTTLPAAMIEISEINQKIEKIQADPKQNSDELPVLLARISVLENHEFELGTESLEAELEDYDAIKKHFLVRVRSKIDGWRMVKKGTIPLSPEAAKVFQQQWRAGLIKPEGKMKPIDESPELVLVNTADRSVLRFWKSTFMTAEARQDKLERIYHASMIKIPAGSFVMGDSDHGPIHKVNIDYSFEICATEVTQGQWQALMGKDPIRTTSCGERCPVEKVSWEDAQAFIQKLNEKTGKHYRLPTEAEWEYACRAGNQRAFCGGDEADNLAWFDANSANAVHPVATKKPNAYGLYDMSGNVWEWVQDDHQNSYANAPTDGSARQGEGALRVVRGGSRSVGEPAVRATSREGFEPTYRFLGIGFRLARVLPPQQK